MRAGSTQRRRTGLPLNFLIASEAIILALGQLAVPWPALRAASVPPAEVTRTV
ncbi:MAG TPA: hypothetical protein VHX52_04285 [Steroidobacteraceae bacterium]|nr:hypothetical protein [Steroidobacteraceae bacterium]